MSDSATTELEDLPQASFEGTVDTDALHTDGDNPNEMTDEQFGLLCDRMRQNGWLGGPIITDTEGLIADGEHRWRAAQDIGLGEVPVRQYEIDDATRRLWRQELNKIHGEHDSKRDALEYDYLLDAGKSDEVHDLVNAADEDLDELLEEIKMDNSAPAQYEYDAEHNVYFEDCVDGMAERLDDDSVDCVITDPPYGIDFQSNNPDGANPNTPRFDTIDADESVEDAIQLYRETLTEIARVLSDDGHFYAFTRWDVFPAFVAATGELFEIKNCLVWAKNDYGMGDLSGNYSPQHEFIIYATAGDGRPIQSDHRPSNILEYGTGSGSDYDHPTEKPASLISELVCNSTTEGDTVLDPFMGSGTTAVAAIQNDRDYVGFEVDEDNYRDVIERRIGEAKRQQEASVNTSE